MLSSSASLSHADLVRPKFQSSNGSCPVLLIFSPFFESPHPYLAVPHLSAYLRSHGCKVLARDYNAEFFRLGRRADFLDFVKALLLDRLAQRNSEATESDVLAKHLGLAAIASLKSEAGRPLYANELDSFTKKLYCLLRGFGFPDHHLYNHDFADFLDDYLLFQRVDDRTRDPRFPWRSASTIDQVLSANDIMNENRNLYLSVFERFFLPDMLAQEPGLVGISIPTNEQVIPALSLAWLIKQRRPGIHLTLGGAFVSHMGLRPAKTLASFPFVDSLVLHEGELPLLGLVQTLERGSKLTDVPNLLCRVNGRVQATPPCKPEDLLDIPAPDYDDFSPVLEDSYALSVYAARGCYWARCNYCNYVVLGAEGATKHHRNTAAIHLAQQLEQLQSRYGVSSFRLVTEAFPPSLCRELSEEVLQRNLRVKMNTWVRAEDQFTPELCSLMSTAGLVEITVGVESFCDRVLHAMDKGYKGLEAARIINNMLDANMSVQINIIVGYPTETHEESEESLRVLKTEVGLKRLPALSVFPFVLFDNIGVYQKMEEYGLEGFPRVARSGHFFHKGIFVRYKPSRGMSLREVGEMALRFASEFELAKVSTNHSGKLSDDTLLSPGQDISCIKVASLPVKAVRASSQKSEPAWLVVNFAAGSSHSYPLAIGNFFAWIASLRRTTVSQSLQALRDLCNIRPKSGITLLQEMVDNGILHVLLETTDQNESELSEHYPEINERLSLTRGAPS